MDHLLISLIRALLLYAIKIVLKWPRSSSSPKVSITMLENNIFLYGSSFNNYPWNHYLSYTFWEDKNSNFKYFIHIENFSDDRCLCEYKLTLISVSKTYADKWVLSHSKTHRLYSSTDSSQQLGNDPDYTYKRRCHPTCLAHMNWMSLSRCTVLKLNEIIVIVWT